MPAQEAHTGYQSDQSEIVVTMQVGDENMIYPASPDLVLIHLCLRAFPAIDQEKMVIQRNHLGCWVPVESRYGRIISKYGYREHRWVLGMINGLGPKFS